MTVGLLVVDCLIGNGQSLKEKRKILLALFQKLRKEFNLSVTEVEFQNLWQRSKLAMTWVNNDTNSSQRIAQSLIRFFEQYPNIILLDHQFKRLY